MGDSQEKQGLFAVRISIKNGVPVAILTGKHFNSESIDTAYDLLLAESKNAILRSKSPVYLVKDSVVKLALDAMRNALSYGMSSCRAGNKGKPCGTCMTCLAAKDEAFTRVVLGSIEPIEGFQHLQIALSRAIGSTRVDATWDIRMSDKEVEEVFSSLGVTKTV